MAHTMSASVLKNGQCRSQILPRKGCETRRLYDLFQANKGRTIDFVVTSRSRPKIISLVDTYGLDIRCVRYRKWCLCGEWFGKVYVDYVAEQEKGDV